MSPMVDVSRASRGRWQDFGHVWSCSEQAWRNPGPCRHTLGLPIEGCKGCPVLARSIYRRRVFLYQRPVHNRSGGPRLGLPCRRAGSGVVVWWLDNGLGLMSSVLRRPSAGSFASRSRAGVRQGENGTRRKKTWSSMLDEDSKGKQHPSAHCPWAWCCLYKV